MITKASLRKRPLPSPAKTTKTTKTSTTISNNNNNNNIITDNDNTDEKDVSETKLKRLFGTLYLWRPKQKIFFRSLYLWEREESTNEYYFGTNESLCSVIIKNTPTVANIHAKICLNKDKIQLETLTKDRILKVCLPSANPGLQYSIQKGSQRGNQIWYVDDVEFGEPQELEDWSVFSVERKVFMIRLANGKSRRKEKDEIAYCFGEESSFNKVFGLVHQLKKCYYSRDDNDGDDDGDVNEKIGENAREKITKNIINEKEEEEEEEEEPLSKKAKIENAHGENAHDKNGDEKCCKGNVNSDSDAVAPEGMALRFERNKKFYDVESVRELCKKYHLQRYGMCRMALGEIKTWGQWRFVGVYDPKSDSVKVGVNPIKKIFS